MILSLGNSSTCEVCNKQCNIEKELETCIAGQKHASLKSGRHLYIWVSNDQMRKKNLHGSDSFIVILYYVYQLCTLLYAGNGVCTRIEQVNNVLEEQVCFAFYLCDQYVFLH